MKSNRHILILDIGSGSGRAIVFDTSGKEVSFAQTEWLPKMLPEYPGSQVFDTKEAWRILSLCIQQALIRGSVPPESIIGVSATSMREGMVLYDQKQREIWACPNVDARAGTEAVEMLEMGIAEKLYDISGSWLNIIAPPRFRWIKKYEPEIFKNVKHISMLSDWALYKLSGQIVTDPTIGSSSGLFDLHTRTWSDEAIEMCELPQHIFPPVFESGSVIGEVTKEAAVQTGLKAGTPVITGGADSQLALLGVGDITSNSWSLVGGTFWIGSVIWDQPLIDPQFRPRCLCHTIPNQWMLEGLGFLIGQQARWLRDGFCQEEVRTAKQQGRDPYHLMEKLAEQVPPGANGVMGFFSDFHNSKSWKHPSPSFLNFNIYDPQHSGKAECIRALWESAVYVSYKNLLVLKELTGTRPEQVTFCGGSSKGFLWPQILADVFGIPVKIPLVKESTALGCAMCVGVGTGEFNSFHDAVKRWVKTDKILQPDVNVHEEYLIFYERWREVLDDLLKIVDKGLLMPMWKAPGV